MKDEFAPRSGWTGRFLAWLDGDLDLLIDAADAAEEYDAPREEIKEKRRERRQRIYESERGRAIRHAERRGFYIGYTVIAVICCVLLIGVLLYAIANLPRYGQENRETVEVVERYVEHGVQETGAVNIVAGMILDYRAFDTLGESHVLLTCARTSRIITPRGSTGSMRRTGTSSCSASECCSCPVFSSTASISS